MFESLKPVINRLSRTCETYTLLSGSVFLWGFYTWTSNLLSVHYFIIFRFLLAAVALLVSWKNLLCLWWNFPHERSLLCIDNRIKKRKNIDNDNISILKLKWWLKMTFRQYFLVSSLAFMNWYLETSRRAKVKVSTWFKSNRRRRQLLVMTKTTRMTNRAMWWWCSIQVFHAWCDRENI